MTFRQHISRFVTGEIGLSEMPAIALQAMEQGLDTPSLCILAGLTENENEFVLDRYFKDTLRELSIELPNKRQAAIEVGLYIANEIFEGKRSVFEGVQDIKWKAIETYPFYEERKLYCYDSIYFEKVYSSFLTLEDFRDAGSTYWQTDKTDQELEQELTLDLVTELRKWSELMKSNS